MQRSLVGDITLTKLVHFIKVFSDSKGNKQKCLVLPIEMNHFKLADGDVVRMPVRVIVRDEADQYKQHGFIAQRVDSKTYKEASSLEQEKYKNLPIIGNLRDFNDSAADTAGRIEEPMQMQSEPGDDLPF